jgi:uncharacterized protein (DUF1800 family)
MRKLLIPLLIIPTLVTGAGKSTVSRLFDKKLPNDRKTVHALNRLTFGPRSADVEAVRKMGLKKWIDRQLNPSQIQENPELLAKLKPLDTLQMPTRVMIEYYPTQQMLAAMARRSGATDMLPKDPELRARAERLVEIYKRRINRDAAAQEKPKSLNDLLDPDQVKTLRTGATEEKVRLLTNLSEDKLAAVAAALPGDIRRPLFSVSSTGLQRKLLVSTQPQAVPGYDLSEAKLLRAVYSNRQLEEVMVDFWYNHFNVFLDKGNDRFLVTSYERDSIRPYVLGKFKDMLVATAQDPAMLFYLDNWQSVAPPTPEALAKMGTRARNARGLNENYARELLELHTLGVDGVYTQKDIIAVARCFTGWTISNQPRGGGGGFEFNDRVHDKGEKLVLGAPIPAGGGKEDGLKVLDILVHHPSTGRFISRKLAQRFVADDPPPALIERMAKTFREKDGDIREVMRTMLSSKEFWSRGAWRSKMKSPLEMIASAIRATGADVESAFILAGQLQQLGEPLYRKIEPTGYSSANAEWTNTAALLARMNFALALAQNKAPGLKVDTSRFEKMGHPAAIAKGVLFIESAPETKTAISNSLVANKAAPNNGKEAAKVVGLVIGGPEFQRR